MYRISRFLIYVIGLVLLLSLVACGTQPVPDYGMNEPVTGEEWEVTVLSAENMGSEFERGGSTIRTDSANTNLLFVRIELESVAGESVETSYLGNVEVRDNRGDTYHWWLAGMAPAVYYDAEAQTGNPIYVLDSSVQTEYIFKVPDDTTTFDLLWQDLPAIRLTVE